MDFGKKGDAKKAMKLMWKEGITLKQAWKKVKSKSKSSKRKGSESPKRKRAQKLAKQAMKLHWKEGITLKQAWKKVQKKNKFGDAVCKEGYEPNPNFKGDGAGRRQPCIKKCDLFFMRDPSTGRCKKMTMVSQGGPTLPDGYEIGPYGRKRKVCPPEHVRNPKGRCVKSLESRGDPAPGMEINPKTGRLRKVCPPGSYRDPTTQRCRKIKTQLQPLIASPPGAVATPWAGTTLMDFGDGHNRNFNLPLVSKKSAPHWPTRGVGIPWDQKLWFGNGRKCGFGSCQTCNMKF